MDLKVEIEYFPYPDDPRIGVSKCGKLYNYKTKKILKQHVLKSGYFNIVISSPGILAKAYRVHRVILKTFSPIDNSDDYFVNHIDGNKLNNDLDNLEWVTPIGNVEHAIDNNLWTTLKPIQVKNLTTGEIIACRSLRKTAIEYNLHLVTLAKHLSCDNAGCYDYNGYAFRYTCDGPWPEIIKRRRSSIIVKCVNILTHELHVFESMAEAAKYCNISYRRLSHYLVTRGDNYYRDDPWIISIN